ncbi:hypothetical protein D5B42_23195 [Salmonella enterica subsp. enterica serovar Oranienburg]|nr:hypothetical protein [Salmonella enterica subsp. enterica serovar Oranienburg]
MIFKLVSEMFLAFAVENIGNAEKIYFSVSSKNVKHDQYPKINIIPFFNVEFNKGMILRNTYFKLSPDDYNSNILNYALNLCFHSEKSFEYENNDELCSIFSMSYYCLMENMNRTLNKEDISKIMTLIN